jgi:dihydroxyacetone kinase
MSALSVAIVAIVERVQAEAGNLNSLDAVAGDGDLGVTMDLAARAVLEVLPSIEDQPLSAVLTACGTAIARKAPSTGGTLLATGLLRAGRCAADHVAPDGFMLVGAIEAAANGIAERGGATAGSKTMLDALLPALAAAKSAAASHASIAEILASAQVAAQRGVEATKAMRPQFGRAGWLADRSMGHPDAGARLVEILFEAMAVQAALY